MSGRINPNFAIAKFGLKNQKMASCLQIFFLVFLFGLACGEFYSGQAASIVNSKHNLSAAGPGSVKASTESQICVFCHAPHNTSGVAPLWNRYESGQAYIPYTSTTAKASVGQPTGSSKMCLSCHDGTVALGMVYSRPAEILFTGGMAVLPQGESNLGIDLFDDHPVSFHYDTFLTSQNPELNNPGSLAGAVKLDSGGQLQCMSCHDPHNDQYGKFLTDRKSVV
jgi:cytochrome c551/c552